MEKTSNDYLSPAEIYAIEERAHQLRAEALSYGISATYAFFAKVFTGVYFRSNSHANA